MIESYFKMNRVRMPLVKHKADSYEGVQCLIEIGNVSSFKLRLNPSNEPSSNIAPYQLVYRTLKFVETGEEYIQSLENECKDNRLMPIDDSNILRVQ